MTVGLRSIVAAGVSAILVTAAGAQTVPSGPGPAPADDREEGEPERIRLRREWFFSTRRAGTTSDAQMAALWRAGMEQTRRAIRAGRSADSAVASHGNLWESMGPSPSGFGGWAFGDVSGRLSALATDASGTALYAGTASGGVWRSTDDGLSWTSLFDAAGTMTVGTVTVDPNDADVLWVGTGENSAGCESYFGIGLLRSTDGGASWEARNGSGGTSLDDLSTFADVVVDPRDSNHIVTGGRIRGCSGGSASSGGLYTSTDAGSTWTNRLSGTRVYEIQQDPVSRDIFWAATGKGIYKSIDNAVSWTLQTASGLPNGSTGRTELTIAPSSTDVVYALFASGGTGREFWRTTDGGGTWSLQSSGSNACDGQCSYNMVLRVHIQDPDIVYRGTIHVFKSTDAGASWTDLSNNWGSSQKVHQDTHALLMHKALPDSFFVGSDGGVWKSEDGGANFLNRNGNLNVTQFYAVGIDENDPGTACGGAQDNSSLARTTSDRWELQVATGDGFRCYINPDDPNYAYAASYPSIYPQIYRSTTGLFGSYSVITNGNGINAMDRSNWNTPYLLDPMTPSTMYLGTQRAYRSTDNGSNWQAIGPADLTNGGTILSLEMNRAIANVLFAGTTDGNVWRATNPGGWTDISAGLPSRAINDIGADPSDADRALAVVGGFGTAHVWEWTASGGWTARGGGLPDVPANTVLMRTSDDVFVGTDTGVFRSTDGGASFVPFMDGLPEGLVVTDLKYDEPRELLTAGTYGRGAWRISLGAPGPDPGTIPATALFELLGGGQIEASWSDACNIVELPDQSYSIQAGDLPALVSGGGAYAHTPVASDCARSSPSLFTPGAADEYYLVVPNDGASEGGAGTDSTGALRPQASTVCGPRAVAACP